MANIATNPLVRLGYRLTMHGNWFSDLWSRIWFRCYCPYPIIADYRASACIASNNCGCGNRLRAALKAEANPGNRPPDVSRAGAREE